MFVFADQYSSMSNFFCAATKVFKKIKKIKTGKYLEKNKKNAALIIDLVETHLKKKIKKQES